MLSDQGRQDAGYYFGGRRLHRGDPGRLMPCKTYSDP